MLHIIKMLIIINDIDKCDKHSSLSFTFFTDLEPLLDYKVHFVIMLDTLLPGRVLASDLMGLPYLGLNIGMKMVHVRKDQQGSHAYPC